MAKANSAGPSTGSGSSKPANSTSSSSAAVKIAITSSSLPSYDNTNSDVVRLYCAIAVPCRLPTVKRPHVTHEHLFQTQAEVSPMDLQDNWIIDSGASCNICLH